MVYSAGMSDQNRCVNCDAQLTPERVEDGWGVCPDCASDNNPLDNRDITCAQCKATLGWVLHSPFYDEHYLYCDSCPRRVEVSFYDPETVKINEQFFSEEVADDGENKNEDEVWAAYFMALEERLAPCPCGGTFRHNAPRRCLYCSAVIPEDPDGRDVWPGDGNENCSELIITTNIWRK